MSNAPKHELVRGSNLKSLIVSPKAYRHRVDSVSNDDTPSKLIGRAFHCLVLEPERFGEKFIVWHDRRAGNEWLAFKELYADRDILNTKEFEKAKAISAAVLSDDIAMNYVIGDEGRCHFEWEIVWVDAATGLRCGGRIDALILSGDRQILTDLKSTARIEVRDFERQCANLHYHLSLAHYRDGLRTLGWRIDEVALVVVESTAPHDSITYRVPEHVLEEGEWLRARLLRQLAECRANDSWPGIARGEVRTLELPEWAYHNEEIVLTMGGKKVAL